MQMLSKNEIIPLTITGVTGEGNGVGRYDGMAVFVPYTAVGDTISCRVQKTEKRFAYGRMLELVTASADRCGADGRTCPVYEKCGGCVWRHVSYEAELRYKQQKVADALQRIGGLSVAPQDILGAKTPDRYRNKAQYPVAAADGKPIAGFYAARSHRVIAQADCCLHPAFFADVVRVVLEWATENGVVPYDEQTGSGTLRHIYIRYGEKTGEVMVCLVAATGKLPALQALSAALTQKIEGFCTLVVNINRARTNVILGDEEYTVSGKGYITDELCGLHFKLSPRSFYQVNRTQAERLYLLAQKEAGLTGNEVLLDLYCGTGTIGLTMAHKAKLLIGADIVAPAIADARENALQNGIENARFLCADAAKAAETLKAEGVCPDVVILDPPRKGCDEALVETVCAMQPRRVVYVSCDPATLSRDLARFAARGYGTKRVTPVDLFPGTMHVESVCLLERE